VLRGYRTPPPHTRGLAGVLVHGIDYAGKVLNVEEVRPDLLLLRTNFTRRWWEQGVERGWAGVLSNHSLPGR
jgi:hypothetical protein